MIRANDYPGWTVYQLKETAEGLGTAKRFIRRRIHGNRTACHADPAT